MLRDLLGDNVRTKGRTFIPILFIAIMSFWTYCSPVQIEMPEENRPVSTTNTINSPNLNVVVESKSEGERAYYKPVSQNDYVEQDSSASQIDSSFESERIASGERVKIERVVDGDTLIVRSFNGRERVRLIGADTPETVKKNWPVEPFGPEASAYTKQRVAESGYVATLVSDGRRTDRYGRRLAFVYLGNDTISLDEQLVRKGLAKACLQYEFSAEMKNKLAAAQSYAKSENLGIHSLSRNR